MQALTHSAAKGKLVSYGGPVPGCSSHRASPQKALTALWPPKVQPKKDLHAPHSRQTPRVSVAVSVWRGPWRTMTQPSTDLTLDT